MPAAMTATMKSAAVETTEVTGSSKAVKIRGMPELVVFPGMMNDEGASAVPTATPVRSVWVAIAVAIRRSASSAHKTE
jgi:hypothetical protein